MVVRPTSTMFTAVSVLVAWPRDQRLPGCKIYYTGGGFCLTRYVSDHTRNYVEGFLLELRSMTGVNKCIVIYNICPLVHKQTARKG